MNNNSEPCPQERAVVGRLADGNFETQKVWPMPVTRFNDLAHLMGALGPEGLAGCARVDWTAEDHLRAAVLVAGHPSVALRYGAPHEPAGALQAPPSQAEEYERLGRAARGTSVAQELAPLAAQALNFVTPMDAQRGEAILKAQAILSAAFPVQDVKQSLHGLLSPNDAHPLQALFLESLAAWEDEEDSVQSEHRDLIARMQAAAEELEGRRSSEVQRPRGG